MKTFRRVLAAAAMAWPLMAIAHAKLLHTTPATGAQLATAPKALTLTFNEAVRLAVLRLSVGGRDIPVTLDRSAPAGAEVSVPLPALGAGIYEVQWSALTVDDGHVVKGTFSFTVASPG
jgi:methionine-rich copper-binding protein CopC